MVSISRRMYVGIAILDRTPVQACSCTGVIERVEILFPSSKIIYLNSPREKPIKITILYRKKSMNALINHVTGVKKVFCQ